MLDIFNYDFILRGFAAGLAVAFVAPLIGTFLVLKRYSLIADTLAHVSLAGVSLGFLLGVNPIMTALGITVASSFGIERLRSSRHIYGESVLALFLSGSLALATVLLSIGHGFNASILNYLFGSLVTVTNTDVRTIVILAAVTAIVVWLFFKELIYVSFDEQSAQVSGIPVRLINAILIILAALTISLAIPIIGVLMISALVVIPVISALQLRQGFGATIFWAEVISLFSVIAGMIASFYLNLSTGGTTVLIMLTIFGAIMIVKKNLQKKIVRQYSVRSND